jgi:DNA (cytosine-5)-methyltransferase 1
VSPPEPFCKAKRAQSVDDDETWEANRPAPTLSVFDSGDTRATVAIVTPAPEPIAFEPRYYTRENKTGGQPSSVAVIKADASKAGDSSPHVAVNLAVRRLTPRECERLQGFPDDWTAIPYRGKPASDGPRYKAIGNSMAVPVMKWIGERIAIVDAATKEEV